MYIPIVKIHPIIERTANHSKNAGKSMNGLFKRISSKLEKLLSPEKEVVRKTMNIPVTMKPNVAVFLEKIISFPWRNIAMVRIKMVSIPPKKNVSATIACAISKLGSAGNTPTSVAFIPEITPITSPILVFNNLQIPIMKSSMKIPPISNPMLKAHEVDDKVDIPNSETK
jgi:hypothetical protein